MSWMMKQVSSMSFWLVQNPTYSGTTILILDSISRQNDKGEHLLVSIQIYKRIAIACILDIYLKLI